MYHSTVPVLRRAAVLALTAACTLSAGKLYTAGPGQQVSPNEVIVKLVNSAPSASLRGLAPTGQWISLRMPRTFMLRLPQALPAGLAAKIAQDPQVAYVEQNRTFRMAMDPPDDTYYGSQWDHDAINALDAWKLLPAKYITAATPVSQRLKVALLDTGVDCTHPDFANLDGTSTDSAQGGQLDWALGQTIVSQSLAAPVCPWQDDVGHGTHIAGILGAAANNGQGVAGVGYSFDIIPYKVLNSSGLVWLPDLADAIESAADSGARVISMSITGPGYSGLLQDALNYAWQRNVVVVVAAGNQSTSDLYFPAGANYVLGVSATDNTGMLADFSNYGDTIDIAAPGVNILSTFPSYIGMTSSYYLLGSGTSTATPHVSAVAGMLALTTPGVAVDAIAQRLQQAASSPVSSWNQGTGYGVVDAKAALLGVTTSAAGGIVGQVVDDQDRDIDNAIVSIGSTSVMTGDGGLFRIPNLAQGDYTMTISAPSYTTHSMPVTVIARADSTVRVNMDADYGTFTGVVTAGGQPVAGVIVQALANGLVLGATPTNASGIYNLPVPVGSYTLKASGLGYATGSQGSGTVNVGDLMTQNLTLTKFGRVKGAVRDDSNQVLSAADVFVSNAGVTAGAISDVNGNYATIPLVSGMYNATATVPLGTDSVNGVTVGANDATVNFSIELAHPLITVTPGTATLSSGDTLQFHVAVTDLPSSNVTWSVSPLRSGSISADGLFTAPARVLLNQTVVITATSTDNSSISGSATIQLARPSR